MFEAPINAYLARALADSPRARELCVGLEGRRVELHITGLPSPLRLTAANGALHYSAGAVHMSTAGGTTAPTSAPTMAPADVTVSGSALSLWALARGDTDAVLAQGHVSVSGDEDLMRQFQELARLLRPDAEAGAGHLVGRIPAHLVARAFGALAGWSRAAGESLARNAADYLAHESRDLVPRAEAESHIVAVEALRAQAAAAEGRLARLAERLDALAPEAGSATTAGHATRRG